MNDIIWTIIPIILGIAIVYLIIGSFIKTQTKTNKFPYMGFIIGLILDLIVAFGLIISLICSLGNAKNSFCNTSDITTGFIFGPIMLFIIFVLLTWALVKTVRNR